MMKINNNNNNNNNNRISTYSLLLLFILFILNIHYSISDSIGKSNVIEACLQEEVDYLVLGAGTAGSIIASKLSEDPLTSVLIVERGEWDSDPYIYNTSDWVFHWIENLNPRFTHTYFGKAEPKFNGRKPDNTVATFAGGCSGHNAMVANSGSAKFDFDKWSHFTEDTDHNWSGSTAIENMKELYKIFQYRGLDRNRTLLNELGNAIEAIGYNFTPNHLSRLETSGYVSRYYWYDENEKRVTPYSRMLKDNGALEKRNNLNILVNHRAIELDYAPLSVNNNNDNINNDQSNYYSNPSYRVKGVWIQNTETHKKMYIRVKKEVILSMGSIETPKFLQLNGVGDRRHLTSLGIETVLNSPWVGKHLQDHIYLFLQGREMVDSLQNSVIPQRTPMFDGFQIFGPKNANVTGNKYIIGVDFGKNDHGRLALKFTLESNRPLSRGYVKITSKDPYADPEIFTNFLDNPRDIEDMIDSLRECLILQEELIKMGVINGSSSPSDSVNSPLTLNSTRQNFIDYVKENSSNDYHLCGSVRMGPKNDNASPLDHQLRVKGLSNVRVVDASVFPAIPGSPNTSVPVSLIALQAAKIIKAQNQ